MVTWKGLKTLFENKDKKLIHEVVETNPEVKGFVETHPDYRIRHDKKFPAASLKELQALLNYSGPEELLPKARAAVVEEVRESLRSGEHPESLADYAHLENLVLFDVEGTPELVKSEPGEWVYNHKNYYSQNTLKVYVDPVKEKTVNVTPFVRTYTKHENCVQKRVPYRPGRLWRAANLP